MKEFDSKEILNEDSDLKGYINKLVNDIRDDVEVYQIIKSLGLTVGEVRDNVAKLADFKDDYNYCKNCPGIDKCDKTIPHLSTIIKKEGSFVITSHEPCKKILEQMKFDSLFVIKDFPLEWKNSRLKTIDLSENRRPLIKEFASILKGQSTRWLYAKGNHKIGKSYLMATFANEYAIIKGEKVAVANCNNLFKYLADSSMKNPMDFQKDMETLINVPLLVLDDFGEEYKNEYIRDSIVIPLLSEREHNSKLTFFVSEFDFDEIQQLYSVGKISGELRGKQIKNILKEMCVSEFDITGTSIYKK